MYDGQSSATGVATRGGWPHTWPVRDWARGAAIKKKKKKKKNEQTHQAGAARRGALFAVAFARRTAANACARAPGPFV
jgi:hypothetical protein